MRSIDIKSRFGDYQVKFHQDILSIKEEVKSSIVIVDYNVYKLYEDSFDKNVILFDAVEQNKTLEGAQHIFRELIKRGVKSNGKVFVVGGGVLQDVAGFACSTYCRGIEYHLVPTTLLAQADSCIGGKTSINFESVKNILGTFYPPKQIHIATEFLKTLTESDYLSGMGEIIKFNLLKGSISSVSKESDISNLILDGLSYKASIIQIDEFDKNERKFLNFGHTFGHALESTSNYQITHGTSVLFGILIANKVSNLLGLLSIEKEIEYFNLIYPYISHQQIELNWFNFDKLFKVIKHDKKNTGVINMVLLTDTEPQIKPIESEDTLKFAVNNIYEAVRLRNKVS